jgi:hypothetical protein
MNRALRWYMDFFMDEVMMESKDSYRPDRAWTTTRIVGAATLAIVAIVITFIVGLFLLAWLFGSPISFLFVVVLPTVLIGGLYRAIKKAAQDHE